VSTGQAVNSMLLPAFFPDATPLSPTIPWKVLDRAERDSTILGILQKLDGFTKVGAHRGDIWESHWSESKATFLNSGGELSALDPAFTGAHSAIRLHGD
jgi:hypothetical protein